MLDRAVETWGRFRTPAVVFCALVMLTACASAPYSWQSDRQYSFETRATATDSGLFAVRASVLGPEEASEFLGIDVYDRDVQPVWIEVHNRDDARARIAISSVDPKYFPPSEVAWFFKKQHSREGWMDLEARLIDLALPRHVEPGETVAGLIFTNETPGTKAFNLDVFRGAMPPQYEQFTFFVRVPGFVPDYANVRMNELVPPEERVNVDEMDLEAALAGLDCCTVSAEDGSLGRPMNVFIIGQPLTLLRSLLRAGWVESSASEATGDENSGHRYFGRPVDGLFRKPRAGAVDRSELAIWRTPIEVDGQPVFAAQVRHSVGRRFELGNRFFGERLDPDVDEGRNYIMQTFWYAQALQQWALAATGEVVPEADPKLDFLGNPWFSLDGEGVVIWLSRDPVPMNETRFLDWQGRPTDQTTGQTTALGGES